MPCPFFEPNHPVAAPAYVHARLPLIEEYAGLCHAGTLVQAPEDLRFQCCNHGYSRGVCGRFPPSESRSALRYTVVSETADALHVLCIEERDHIPAPSLTVQFDLATSSLAASELNIIATAQALAFCRSYAERFLRTS